MSHHCVKKILKNIFSTLFNPPCFLKYIAIVVNRHYLTKRQVKHQSSDQKLIIDMSHRRSPSSFNDPKKFVKKKFVVVINTLDCLNYALSCFIPTKNKLQMKPF